MKKPLRFLLGTLFLILSFIGICYLSGNDYLIRGIRLSYLKGNNSANIYDYNDFNTRVVANSGTVSPLPRSTAYNALPLSDRAAAMLLQTHSTSFLVLKNDSIVMEKYFDGHTDSTRSNSFSMAKSIISMMVQQAIDDKFIVSWDDKVSKYLPWLQGPYAAELTLRHLSTMTSGIEWDEAYVNPFSVTAKAYYGEDIEKLMKSIPVKDKPGQEFRYQSGSTQLLGLALGAAVKMSLSQYASENLWKPLGAEYPALWSLDHSNGKELAYCCFSAITRDFARLGRMVLHQGRLDVQIVDSQFMQMATQPYKSPLYGHGFWLGTAKGEKFVLLQGIQGQFIIVIPSKNLVVVRTGHEERQGAHRIPECAQTYSEEALAMFGN